MSLIRTHQTLLQQMNISDAEIQNRLMLVDLSYSDTQAIKSAETLISERVDEIVESFYQHQLAIDEIAILIGDADTLNRLKIAQHAYILDLFRGRYDGDYVNNRLRIGMVHKRIGVEPKLYLCAMRSLRNILFETIRGHFDPADESAILSALDKLLYFDTTLGVDTYIDSMISELELAKKRTREYADSLELKVQERTRELEEQTRKDPLTNLFNRRYMHDISVQILASAKRRNAWVSVAYFDVDAFKQINDRLGHVKGDEVLNGVAQAILSNVRDSDIPCRYGGDEFCVIFPDTDRDMASRVCQRIIETFSRHYPEYSLSIGIHQHHSANEASLSSLINKADQNMYLSKRISGSSIHA